MTWIILALLVLLALWIGVGMLLLARNARKRGGDYSREVAGSVYGVGDEVGVTLRLVAPARMQAAEDHDVVLALDHSGSMGGGPGSPLREAIRAAENFVLRLPDNIHAGLVVFDHEAQLLCPPTAQHRRVLRAAGAMGSGGGTAIHAALERSREALREGRPGVRKTVILLSDGASAHEPAVEAARRLREEFAGVNVVCVSFGAASDEGLLRAIANSPHNYLKVSATKDLYTLFSFLAAAVSGQMAVAGVVDEGARAPRPFRLARTGGLYPVGVQSAEQTRIFWSVPLMGQAPPVPLTYDLVPECPGWHAVASQDSRAVWRMPDGTRVEQPGPDGPRVLAMPRWLRWAWPVLNPLFWMLFGRFWPCAPAARAAETAAPPTPLPASALPALPPQPQERVYEPRVRPAVVVGIGAAGEWTVCRLKQRLRDREVDPRLVDLLAIHVTHRANREPVSVGGVMLEEGEQAEVHQDLRPYLESLRACGAPPPRRWIPWRRWLAETTPQTTMRSIGDDRRKARLALIRNPRPVEERLVAPLRRVLEQDGLVVVVGSPTDAECSGLLAEVSHVCAAAGAGVTAVFTPTSFFRAPSASEAALALELERMSLMSGRNIVSDRHDPPVEARQLFNRIVVLEQQAETPEEASLPASELIWGMLAYEEVFEQFPVLRREGGEVFCNGVHLDANALPAAGLWRWARSRALAAGVNGRRLGLIEDQGRLMPRLPDRRLVQDDAEAFWSGQSCTRPQNLLLGSARPVLQSDRPEPISALLALQDGLPTDRPYHEQVDYARREQQTFAAYFEEWSQNILAREQGGGSWGLHVLMPALLRIEDDLRLVITRLRRLSGNEDFANLVSFATSVYVDLLATVSGLREGVAEWMSLLVGAQVSLHVGPPPEGAVPVAEGIERERQAAEESFAPVYEGNGLFLEQKFDEWFKAHGEPVLGQFRFRIGLDADTRRARIQFLHADEAMEPGADTLAALRDALDQYRNLVLSWPLEKLIPRKEVSDPLDRFRVGKYSALAYPDVRRAANEDDPFVAAAILVRERTIRQALSVATTPAGEMPFIWPEESNAARIAEKIRNRLAREPQPFSPIAVHLMRDTGKLYSFFEDIARGRLEQRGTRFVLRRGEHEYDVGPASETWRGLDLFEGVAQQVVSCESSTGGERITPPVEDSALGYDELARAVEQHPLASEAAKVPAWEMWRDVIRGLLLEHGTQPSPNGGANPKPSRPASRKPRGAPRKS
jgi:uncharacterized protein YegL